MAPTIASGDRVYFTSLGGWDRGDVVTVRIADERTPDIDRLVVSRVIGLGGETIEIRDGEVVVDGAQLEETYLPEGVVTEPRDESVIKIPADHVFIMGDNRSVSQDSRWYGPVAESNIDGRLVNSFWWPFPF